MKTIGIKVNIDSYICIFDNKNKLLIKKKIKRFYKYSFNFKENKLYYLKIYSLNGKAYKIPFLTNKNYLISICFHNNHLIKIILIDKNYKNKIKKGEILLWQNNIQLI